MRHTRDELLDRAIGEYEKLDALVEGLSAAEWTLAVPWAEPRDPWTVKDALVHVTYWKADVARLARGQRRPPEVRGLGTHDYNHWVFEQWRLTPVDEVIAWHRATQTELLEAIRDAPAAWLEKERARHWPVDIDGHSRAHRVRDMERALRREI